MLSFQGPIFVLSVCIILLSPLPWLIQGCASGSTTTTTTSVIQNTTTTTTSSVNQRNSSCRCAPGASDYPHCFGSIPWQTLNQSLQGRLVGETDLHTASEVNPSAAVSDAIFVNSQPGFSYYSGYLSVHGGGSTWSAAMNRSHFAVIAETVDDVRAAVVFAKDYNLRLVVKSTGNDFFGRGFARGSLLIWTHRMTSTLWEDMTICGESVPQAATAGAGVQMWQLYNEAQQRGRYVVGGTCAGVGHVGLTTGGGYGSYSKFYGSSASNVVQAEMVLADGTLVKATPCNEHSDLLRALRGGGGGSFGVVTSITYRTFDKPKQFGNIRAQVLKPTPLDGTLSLAIQEFVNNLRDGIINKGMLQHIGGFFNFANPLYVNMNYVGLSQEECQGLFVGVSEYLRVECSARGEPMWPDPGAFRSPYGVPGQWVPFWQNPQTSGFHLETMNRYIQEHAFDTPASTKRFADEVESLSKSLVGVPGVESWWQLAFNYALGGGSDVALRGFEQTSLHPDVKTAVGVLKLERFLHSYLPDGKILPQAQTYISNQDLFQARLDSLLGLTAGAYLNEAAYAQPNWQQVFWGPNYNILRNTKRKYDPHDLFVCHQCVGSERWTTDGNCHVATEIDRVEHFDGIFI